MPKRNCEGCNKPMPRNEHRERKGNRLLCKDCVTKPNQPGWSAKAMYRPVAVINKTAHESQSFEDVLHCPFDGSGQLVGGSDGNINCSFCGRSFLVRIQPQFSAMPQTSPDGMPIEPGPTLDEDPAQLEHPADDPEGDVADPAAEDEDASGGQTNSMPAEADEDEINAQSMLITHEGIALPYNDFLKYLAIHSAFDKEAVLREVRNG